MKLDLKNAFSVHSNLRGATHGRLGLLSTNTKYATLSKVLYVRPVHPRILLIPNNATHVAFYEIKCVYDNILWVFHEVQGVEQAPIQQVIKYIYEQKIISMKNSTTGHFTVNIRQIFA